jgi:thiol-disulfide isomerase/thioredoxin
MNSSLKISNALIIALAVSLFPLFSFCQGADNPDRVFLSARQTNKHVLVVFSGSDWCLPCDRVNKTILSDSAFRYFASENLVLIDADFPQRTKLPPEQVARNEKLAEAFNPNGNFPYLVLLNPDKTIITILDYLHYDAADFIEEIKNALLKSGK